MAKTTNADVKEFAEALFMQGTPQNIIAEKVGVSANTVSRWAKDYHWGEKRAAQILTRKEVVNNVLRSINKLDKEASVVDFIECFMAFGKWLEYQSTTDPEISAEFRKMVNKYQNKYIMELLGTKI